MPPNLRLRLVGYVGSLTIDLSGSAEYFGLVAVMMLVAFGLLAVVGRHGIGPKRRLKRKVSARPAGRASCAV